MRISALIGAAALAAGTLAAMPAGAQRYGHHDGYRGHHNYGHGYRYGGYRHGYGYGGYRHGYGYGGYRHGDGYGYHGYRGRVVCRVHRGRFGPVRSCFRR